MRMAAFQAIIYRYSHSKLPNKLVLSSCTAVHCRNNTKCEPDSPLTHVLTSMQLNNGNFMHLAYHWYPQYKIHKQISSGIETLDSKL